MTRAVILLLLTTFGFYSSHSYAFRCNLKNVISASRMHGFCYCEKYRTNSLERKLRATRIEEQDGQTVNSPTVVEPLSSILPDDEFEMSRSALFLAKAGTVGAATGLSVILFKSSIAIVLTLFYENLADALPKPVFYWPFILYPLLGSALVSAITFARGPEAMSHGVDYIVKTLADKKGGVEASVQALESNIQGISRVLSTKIKPEKEFMTSSGAVVKLQDEPEYSSLPSVVRYGVDSSNVMPMNLEIDSKPVPLFDPLDLLSRTVAAVCTLGSGCSLGPEGPCVEIGAGVSRMLSGTNSSLRERHHLLLAGVAGGVAAGFNAPIAGVFFAIECGNRFLTKNGIVLSSTAKGDDIEDGPRADIAAIVLSATVAALVVQFSSKEATLSIQGNVYSMVSPLFEFPLYLGLGILCGAISVLFANMRDFFKDFFQGKQQIFAGDNSILNGSIGRFFADLPAHYKPLLGGLICGIVAVFYPQTLFVGYAILDELLAGRFPFGLSLIFQLLFLKMFLTSFSLGSGLVGGTFAPALFFGAAAGTAYHNLLQSAVQVLTQLASSSGQIPLADTMSHFLVLAGAPAYATVGAAATLGALFRAPLTASMLMFEVTQNHDIILPVLASTGVAGLFAEIICRPRRQGK